MNIVWKRRTNERANTIALSLMPSPTGVQMIMRDFISASERLNPPKWGDFFYGIWLRYQLKCAEFEMEKAKETQANWRWIVLNCQDRLRELGVDPQEQPEDITKMLEIWLIGGILFFTGVGVYFFLKYREVLADLIIRSM